MSSLIEVILKQEEKVRLPKNHYSYTELEDLESRLVLIAGKDEKDKNKEHVDTYLRVSHFPIKLVTKASPWIWPLECRVRVQQDFHWVLKLSC